VSTSIQFLLLIRTSKSPAVVVFLLVCIASWIWRVAVTKAQTTTSTSPTTFTRRHSPPSFAITVNDLCPIVRHFHSFINTGYCRSPNKPTIVSLVSALSKPLLLLCLSLCRLLLLSIHPAPGALVILFQVPVSLLALSFYISTPPASLEGSRKPISDITTTRKNLTPPTTKVPDNYTFIKDIKFLRAKKETTILSTHKSSTKIFLRRFEDLLSQISFFAINTSVFQQHISQHYFNL
jgi:hypothetical protein